MRRGAFKGDKATKEAVEVAKFDGKLNGTEDFDWSYTDEPHLSRRKAIMKKYPQVKELMGHCPRTKFVVTGLVAMQVFLAVATREWSWIPYLFVAYVVGATANHALFLAIHELAHDLGFENVLGTNNADGIKQPIKVFGQKINPNRFFAMFANIPIVFPYSVAFKGYHIDHHKFQGVDGVDTDVPTPAEGRFFNTRPRKFAFAFCQILFYALRPMAVKLQTFTGLHAINWAFNFTVDALIIYIFGWAPIGYLLLCTFLAGSIHPTAGHFIAEHYVFNLGQETYSYYGPLNVLAFNVGYHNEHHDFPYIPGSRLPQLKEMAPEFYDERAGEQEWEGKKFTPLRTCDSWPMVIYNYIMMDNITAHSRVKRKQSKQE